MRMCDNRTMSAAPIDPAKVPQLSASPLAATALARAKIAYTDIDGTLLGRGGCLLCDLEGTPCLAAADAAVALNQRAMPLVIISGRTAPMLREISRMLGWRDYIAELGAVRAYDRESEVYFDHGSWSDDDVPAGSTPYEVIENSGSLAALFAAFPGRLEYHSPHHTGRQATHLLRGHVDDGAAQAVLDRFAPSTTWLDNGIINPPATGLVGVDKVHAYHVMPAGVTKAGAIEADLARRGLAREDAVMIGDSAADLAVHGVVGLVVLVANALRSPAVAELAASVPNVVITQGAAGQGWAEFAHAWIAARED